MVRSARFTENGHLSCSVEWDSLILPFALEDALARCNFEQLPQSLHFPFTGEAGQARLACEQLLHGGLLEVALLRDEPFKRAKQRIDVAQGRRDGALFGRWGKHDQ